MHWCGSDLRNPSLRDCVVGNAYAAFYGDVIMVYAVSDLRKGDEVTLSYRGATSTGSLEEREEWLRTYKVHCNCRLCALDRADPNRKERQALLEQCEAVWPAVATDPAGAVSTLKGLIKQVLSDQGYRDLLSML